MQITLIHNPKAGHGKHSKKKLLEALRNAGQEAKYYSSKKSGYKKALKKGPDLALIAGGDGAIGKVASRLVGTGIPLAILPLGTANNLARSLGFFDSPKNVIAELENGKKRAFDVGVARGPWGKRPFFESAGAGLLADYVRDATRKEKKNKKRRTRAKHEELKYHVRQLRKKLKNYRARKWKMELDGKDISDRYILWEAMNIRSVGPALYLAPWAVTKDGELDFVAVRKDDRFKLLKHLDARLAGHKSEFPLPMARFKKLKITWNGSTVHFDDEIWPEKKRKPKKKAKIKIKVKSSALKILQPPTSSPD